MATVTLNSPAQASPLSGRHPTQVQKRYTPSKSSPLACHSSIPSPSPSSPGNTSNITSRRASCFPTSRPIRPFPSVAAKSTTNPAKTFEIPEAFKSGCFMLNLTQAEFSRQE